MVNNHPWQEYNAHGNTCHYPGCRMTEEEHGLNQQDWRHEADVYAEAGQEQPAWSVSEPLGVCPMVCPDHSRHCDNDADHTEPHACSLCEHWSPR